jgi:hypothetical protein
VIQAQLVLELLIVPLDPPAELGEADELGRHRRGRVEPILRGRRFPEAIPSTALLRAGFERFSSRWAGRTRSRAKRERMAPRAPSRHVTVCHAEAGSSPGAEAHRLMPSVRRTRIDGHRAARHGFGGRGLADATRSPFDPTT